MVRSHEHRNSSGDGDGFAGAAAALQMRASRCARLFFSALCRDAVAWFRKSEKGSECPGPDKGNMEAMLSSGGAAPQTADICGWVGVGDGLGVEPTICLPTF
jgi:hypothetical protein